MTETIAHRELRNNSAQILARVSKGESFVITNHGQPVAEIVPHGRTGRSVQDDIDAGIATPATRSLRDLPTIRRVPGANYDEIMADIRGQW